MDEWEPNEQQSAAVEHESDPLYAEPLLEPAEEFALFTEYRRTHDQALRDRLIMANTRLVRKIARHYKPRGMDSEDVAGYGMFGLMTAIEKFDPALGFKFSTMALPWIRQAIQRALMDNGAVIREPVHVQEKRMTALRHDEVAEPQPAWQLVSLDAPRWEHDAESDPWRECIPAEQPSVEDVAIDRAHWHQTLYLALGQLAARERYVIELRYGLSTDGDCMTLEQVGKSMLITRERVRQIETKALTHLRKQLAQDAEGDVCLRMLTLVEQARTRQYNRLRAYRLNERMRRKRTEDQPLLAS